MMTAEARTTALRNLMQRNKLTIDKVAKMLKRKPHTISMYRCGKSRAIPADLLELLKLKVKK